MDSSQPGLYATLIPNLTRTNLAHTERHRQQQVSHHSFATHNADNHGRLNGAPLSAPVLNMNSVDIPRSEGASLANTSWMPPASQPTQQPTTAAEGPSYCTSEQGPSISSWDASMASLQQRLDIPTSQPAPVHQELLPFSLGNTNSWMQKPCDDNFILHGFESDVPIGQAYTTDETVPIIDLRYTNTTRDADYSSFYGGINSKRRMSGSSLTMSTSGPLSDIPSYDDYSTALSEAPSYNSEYPPTSNRTSLMSSTQLSPVPSPRLTPQSRPEQVRSQSRGRASPSPRPSMRSVPYSMEPSRGTKRWSSGSYGNGPNKRQALYGFSGGNDVNASSQRMAMQVPSPRAILPSALPSTLPSTLAMNGNGYPSMSRPSFLAPSVSLYQRNNMLLPSQMAPQLPSQSFRTEQESHDQPPPLPSQSLFRMLQSNGSPHSFHGHYTDLTDPPDLFAALHEEQIPPPPEDMNPSDPDLVPYEQDLRFEGDLYTPRWVRGHGNKREGWCGICKPGRWLVLKNSAFWYDKSFTHGVSAATGSSFQEPLDSRRMDGSPDVWEGLCGSCNDWIALVSSKKKGTTWFRHAYKCHTHPKAKDGAKRRRESNQARALAAQTSSVSTPRTDGQGPMTPHTHISHTPSSVSMSTPVSMGRIPNFSSPNRIQKQRAPAPLKLANSNKFCVNMI